MYFLGGLCVLRGLYPASNRHDERAIGASDAGVSVAFRSVPASSQVSGSMTL